MASTYVNDLRLNELATGDGSGTWGTTTNTNLELIAEGLSFGTEGITTNADTHTSTVADGSTDPARSMFIKYTGTLDSACTITIAPNTMSRVHFIENGTSGSQDIIIKQGSGATVTIPPGDVKVVYLDGAGSGAAVVDAFNSLSVATLNATAFNATDGCTITTADNTTQLTLTSTDADASEGPRLDLQRNSASPADDDVLGTIRYRGENDADEDLVYAEIKAEAKDVSDGTEDSELRFFVRRAGALREGMVLGSESVVFNEGSIDVDFRVESDALTHAFFLEGSSSNVGIGTSSPARSLSVESSNANPVRVVSTGDSANIEIGDSTGSIRIGSSGSGDIGFFTGGAADFTGESQAMTINDQGEVIIGSSQFSAATYFTVDAPSGGRAADIYRATTTASNHICQFMSNVGGSETLQQVMEAGGDVESRTNSYGGISDRTLKENIVDATNQWDDIKALEFKNYNFIGDPDRPQLGVIAQDVEAAGMTGLVKTSEETGKMSVKYSVIYMKAVIALQEAMARIETLETQRADLETRLAALEA